MASIQHQPNVAQRVAGIALVSAGLLIAALLTLHPRPADAWRAAETPLWCLICGDEGMIDVIWNIALFVPVGAGLTLLGASRRMVGIVAFLLSFSIEATQHFVVSGRDPSLSDLVTNTTGALLGALVAAKWGTLRRPVPHQAYWMAATVAAAWLGSQIVMAWGYGQDLGTPPLTMHWAPSDPGRPVFRGEVLTTRLGGAVVSDGDSLTAASLVPMEATIALSARHNGTAPIVRVLSGGVPRLELWRRSSGVVFQPRLRFARLRLRQPTLALTPIARARTDTITVRAGLTRRGMWLAGDTDRGRVNAAARFSTNASWLVAAPIMVEMAPGTDPVTLGWIALWMLVYGSYVRASQPSRRGMLFWLLLFPAWASIPMLLGLGPLIPEEFLVGVAAFGMGFVGSHRGSGSRRPERLGW